MVGEQQLEDFAVLEGEDNELSGLELLEPGDGTGGLIVANYTDIKYINASGIVVKTYDVDQINDWSSVSIDSSGESFWATSSSTKSIYKFNIETGAVELIKQVGESNYGVCVKKQVPPSLVTINGPKSVIAGTANQFTATVSPHDVTLPLTYVWEATGLPSETHDDIISRRDTSPTFTWNTSGEKTVSVTVWNALGEKVGKHTVTVEAQTETTIAPTSVEIIASVEPTTTNTPYAFTAKVLPENAKAPIEYIWEVTDYDGTITQFDKQSNTQTFTWSTEGTKTIKVTAKNDAGQTTATKTFPVNHPPEGPENVTINGPTTGKTNTPYTFIALVENTEATLPLDYEWAAADDACTTPLTHEDIPSYTDNQTCSWSTPGEKTVSVKVWNDYGEVEGEHKITIEIFTPLESVTIVDEPTTGTVDTSYTFQAIAAPDNANVPITYEWTAEGAENPITINPDQVSLTDSQSFTWSSAGEKTVEVVASNEPGITISDTHKITILPYIEPEFDSLVVSPELIGAEKNIGTTGDEYDFTINVGPEGVSKPITYECVADEQEPQSNILSEEEEQTTGTCSFTWDTPGEKNVTVTVSNIGGEDTMKKTIIIQRPPSAITIEGPTEVETGKPIEFTAGIKPDDTTLPVTYTWDVDGYNDNITVPDGDFSNAQELLWDTRGEKSIIVTAQNAVGEITSAPYKVIVADPPTDINITCPDDNVFKTNNDYTFRAQVLPESAAEPFTYEWEATGLDTVPRKHNNRTDTQSFTWTTPGDKNVSVVVKGLVGSEIRKTANCPINIQPVLPESIEISGPTTGDLDESHSFQAKVEPSDVTLPLTFEWVNNPEHPEEQTNESTSLVDSRTWTWHDTCETQRIRVTASNAYGSESDDHDIYINCDNNLYKIDDTTYNWLEIDNEQELKEFNESTGDDAIVDIPLPDGFTFGFYDRNNIDTIYLSNNGLVLFDEPDTSATLAVNQSLSCDTSADCPEYLIAPFWDDLDRDSGYVSYGTVGEGDDQKFVVQWLERTHHDVDDAEDNITFQVIFYKGKKNIKVQYKDSYFGPGWEEFNYGHSATIGIRNNNIAPMQYLEYAYERINLKNAPALCFQYQCKDDPTCTPEPCDPVIPLTTAPTFTYVPVGCEAKDEYELSVSVAPDNVSRPIDYIWYVTGQNPVINRKNVDGLQDTFSFMWDSDDATKTISVTAKISDTNQFTATYTITRSTVAFSKPVYEVAESDGTATITATLSAACQDEVSVGYETVKRFIDTATVYEDFNPVLGTLIFPPYTVLQTFPIEVLADIKQEPMEQITIEMDNPYRVTLGTPDSASLRIYDSPPPTVQFAGPSQQKTESYEGNVSVRVQLEPAVSDVVTVTCVASDGDNTDDPNPDAYPATQGKDYTMSASNAVARFEPGETLSECFVSIEDDAIDEEDEVLTLELLDTEDLHSPNVLVGDERQRTLEIEDDDPAPNVSFTTPAYNVGEDVGTVYVEGVLSQVSEKEITVQYRVGDDKDTAEAGTDYELPESETITIQPSTKTFTISIPIIDDQFYEGCPEGGCPGGESPDETLTVQLTKVTNDNDSIGKESKATIAIADNDEVAKIQFTQAIYEIDEDISGTKGGTGMATIELQRIGDMKGAITVDYTMSNGTARDGSDYIKRSGSVTFEQEEITKTLEVYIVSDLDVEGDETIILSLSNARSKSGDTLHKPMLGSPSVATVLILDRPRNPYGTLQFAQPTYPVSEGDNNTGMEGSIPITIERTGGTSGTLEVFITTFDDTAIFNADYYVDDDATDCVLDANNPRVVKLTFKDGEGKEGDGKAKSCPLMIKHDTFVEGDETINLTLTSKDGKIGQRNATVIIQDNDPDPPDPGAKGVIVFDAASYEVNEDDGTVEVLVRRFGGSKGAVEVTCSSVGGSATAAQDAETAQAQPDAYDYVNTSQSLFFDSSEEGTKPCHISLVDNDKAEGDETIQLSLAIKDSDIELGAQKTTTIKILDDDVAPDSDTSIVQFSDPIYRFSEDTNPNSCNSQAVIKLTRVGGLSKAAKVYYETAGGTASYGSDYTAQSGYLEFESSKSEQQFTIPLCGDDLLEGPETVLLNLSVSSEDTNVELGAQSEATLVIQDATPLPAGITVVFFSQPIYTIQEGLVQATITVERMAADFEKAFQLKYTTSDDTAKGGDGAAGADYETIAGPLQFKAGETSTTFVVQIFPDNEAEGSERLGLHVLCEDKVDADGYCLAADGTQTSVKLGQQNEAVLIITDSTPSPQGIVQFSKPVYEVREDRGEVFIPILREGGSEGDVAVIFKTEDVLVGDTQQPSAEQGVDYAPVNKRISFKPGDTHTLQTIIITRTAKSPPMEKHIELVLSEPTEGGLKLGTQRTALLKIIDTEEHKPGILQFETHSYDVNEKPETPGEPNMRSVKILRVGGGAEGEVCVDYEVLNGSARVGTDFEDVSDTVCFKDGETEKMFVVPILDDLDSEGEEFIVLVLQNPKGGAIIGPQVTSEINIKDDDIPAGGIITFSKPIYKDKENVREAIITVRREGYFTNTVTLTYTMVNGDVYPAYAGVDYIQSTGILTFTGAVTNTNTDSPQQGNGTDSDITVTQELTFTVVITDDDEVEGDEFVSLLLGTPTGEAALGTQRTAYLVIEEDDLKDGQSLIQFGEATYTTRENATVRLTVLRKGDLTKEATVEYTTLDGSAHAEDADGTSDYRATQGTITFLPYETYKTIPITIAEDTKVESDELFQVRLSNAILDNPTSSEWVTLTNELATVTIVDGTYSEYGVFQFLSNGYTVVEGDVQAEIVVVRAGGTKGEVTVDYKVSNDLARSGINYEPVEGTLTFADSVSTQTFLVPIKDDGDIEGNEDITLYLRNLQFAFDVPDPDDGPKLHDVYDVGTLKIIDNDYPVEGLLQFREPSYTAQEDAGIIKLEVERVGGYEGDVTVDYTIYDASARLCEDYGPSEANLQAETCTIPPTGHLTFRGKIEGETPETEKTFDVPILDDIIYEPKPDEALYVVLSNARSGDNEGTELPLGGDTLAVITIEDNDDPEAYVSFVDTQYDLGEDGVDVMVELSGDMSLLANDTTVTVPYTVTVAGEVMTTNTVDIDIKKGTTQLHINNYVYCSGNNRMEVELVAATHKVIPLPNKDKAQLNYDNSNEVCENLVYLPLIAGGQASEPQDDAKGPFALTIDPDPIVISSENGRAKLTVTLKDKDNTSLPGETITFSTKSSIITLEAPTSTTTNWGAVNNIICHSRGQATIVIEARDGLGGTMQKEFPVECNDAPPASITLLAVPEAAEAKHSSTINLTANLLEAGGGPVKEGKEVTFIIDPPLNLSSGSGTVEMTAKTDASGNAQVSLVNDELWAGQVHVTARVSGLEKTITPEFTVNTHCTGDKPDNDDNNNDYADNITDFLNTVNAVCLGSLQEEGIDFDGDDFYKFTLEQPGTLTVFLRGIPDGANYDIELRNGDGFAENFMMASSLPDNNDESITLSSLSADTYYVLVRQKVKSQTATNEYFLGVRVEEGQ